MRQYLDKRLKRLIEGNIKAHVTKRVMASPPGRELAQGKKDLEKKIRDYAKAVLPDKDKRILAKYGLTQQEKKLRFVLDRDGKVHVTYWAESSRTEVKFRAPIVLPKNYELDKLLPADDCRWLHKINYELMCEIDEIVSAYMTRVSKFRTVKKLMENHPEMKKFMPAEVPVRNEPTPGRADKVIKQFEGF